MGQYAVYEPRLIRGGRYNPVTQAHEDVAGKTRLSEEWHDKREDAEAEMEKIKKDHPEAFLVWRDGYRKFSATELR